MKSNEGVYLTKQQVIPVNKINKVKNYTRVDVANCQDLADCIKKVGLMQPIAVTPSTKTGKYDLVFGYRRFTAVTEILNGKDIKADIYLNKDNTPLTNVQRAELNSIENVVRKNPALLEIGPAILEMATEGKGITTIARIFKISPEVCTKTLTAWRNVPQNIIDQVIPHKSSSEPGLSFGHLYKIANMQRYSKKMTREQIVEACNFVLNSSKPVLVMNFGKALQTFAAGGKSFESVYTSIVNKVCCDHMFAVRVSKKNWKQHFGDNNHRQVIDRITLLQKNKQYEEARTLSLKYRKACLMT